MLLVCTNIRWDIEDNEVPCELPQSVLIVIPPDACNSANYADIACDYLSNEYGYCVSCLDVDVSEKNNCFEVRKEDTADVYELPALPGGTTEDRLAHQFLKKRAAPHKETVIGGFSAFYHESRLFSVRPNNTNDVVTLVYARNAKEAIEKVVCNQAEVTND